MSTRVNKLVSSFSGCSLFPGPPSIWALESRKAQGPILVFWGMHPISSLLWCPATLAW